MCGIAGFVRLGGFKRETAIQLLRAMTDRLTHRGPDDEGNWLDETTGIALGHRRLAILDLTSTGHQPMESADGRFIIVFNGEIYNHLTLRADLDREKRILWRGRSDTETLLEAFSCIGVENTLKRTTGMFAFALFDRKKKILFFARDRIGEKPLYYGLSRDTLLFGSELSAFATHPAFQGRLDRNAIALYLRHGFVPAPHSIYEGIRKLPAGTFLEIPILSGISDLPEPLPYWSLQAIAAAGLAEPLSGSDSELTDELERLIARSVAQQRIADVPLGAFLSGGIDSSTIVAMMCKGSTAPVKTFTIGYAEEAFDESLHARDVAKHLSTSHTELLIKPDDALEILPSLPSLYDEPFGDSSALPSVIVARLARQNVTVALSGDGGDELFAGYQRYPHGMRIHSILSRVPHSIRLPLSKILTTLPVAALDSLPFASGPSGERQALSEKVAAFAALLHAADDDLFYRTKFSTWKNPSLLIREGFDPGDILKSLPVGISFLERMMYTDMVRYLPDDILTKIDRAAMAVSLETRVPLLDPELIAFVWRLPVRMKIRNGETKWLLRQVLHRYVPKKLIDRPKRGFAVPVGEWLRGPLRSWADNLLDPSLLASQGIFNPAPIIKRWQQHRTRQFDWQHHLWPVLMFQAWLENRKSIKVNRS